MFKLKIKGIHLHKNGKLFGFGVGPNNDWAILFIAFIILAIVVTAIGVYIYIAIANGDIFLVAKPNPPEIKQLDVDALQNTINYYDARAVNLELLKKNPNILVDPAL